MPDGTSKTSFAGIIRITFNGQAKTLSARLAAAPVLDIAQHTYTTPQTRRGKHVNATAFVRSCLHVILKVFKK